MRVLAVGAHFDDVELGCGGALIQHVRAKDKVTALVVTDSEYVNYDGRILRKKKTAFLEGQRAAKIIGADLICGNMKTKEVTYNSKLIEFLNKFIDDLKIDLIYTHWDHDVHQDHSAIGKATLNAGRHIPRILMYRSNWYQTSDLFRGTYYVDISDVMDVKIKAVKAHATEYRKVGKGWIEFFKNENRNNGQEIGVRYAEVFEVIKYLNMIRRKP